MPWLSSNGLRGYDAVHLAGALLASEAIASADSALCEAAVRQGLHVADPLDAGVRGAGCALVQPERAQSGADPGRSEDA